MRVPKLDRPLKPGYDQHDVVFRASLRHDAAHHLRHVRMFMQKARALRLYLRQLEERFPQDDPFWKQPDARSFIHEVPEALEDCVRATRRAWRHYRALKRAAAILRAGDRMGCHKILCSIDKVELTVRMPAYILLPGGLLNTGP